MPKYLTKWRKNGKMNAEFRIQNAECRMQNAKCKMQNAKLAFPKEGKGDQACLVDEYVSEKQLSINGILFYQPSF